MIVQSLIFTGEAYTHKGWGYRHINVGFSRLYYILDGEAYYEEEGRRVLLRRGYLYLTPVKHDFSLSENPDDKLLHTFAHITTHPAVTSLVELPVIEGTPLHDAVMLWRRYANCEDTQLLLNALRFLISCLPMEKKRTDTVPEQVRRYVEQLGTEPLSMQRLSHELGYSREHLTRTYFSSYGMTPKQYSTLCRMNLAQKRLLQGDRVYEVADALRFSSPFAFSKAFKAHFGVSPEQFVLAHTRTHGE